MGWMFVHRDAGQTTKEFFEHEFRPYEILACSSTPAVTYLALRAHTGEVYGMVVLTQYRTNDYYNFGYKDMEETMGPCESKCPEKILKLLSPTTHEYALAWRERCWQYIKDKKAVKTGNVVIFKEPIHLTNGAYVAVAEIESMKPLRLRALASAWEYVFRMPRAHLTSSVKEVLSDRQAFNTYTEQLVGALAPIGKEPNYGTYKS